MLAKIGARDDSILTPSISSKVIFAKLKAVFLQTSFISLHIVFFLISVLISLSSNTFIQYAIIDLCEGTFVKRDSTSNDKNLQPSKTSCGMFLIHITASKDFLYFNH